MPAVAISPVAFPMNSVMRSSRDWEGSALSARVSRSFGSRSLTESNGLKAQRLRVSGADAIARHKTDWRSLYDGEHARMNEASGCDEIVFLNERDELVEGSRTNLVLKRGERLLTPPLSSGCLDGCLRRDLVEQGRAVEATLPEGDLVTGTLYLGNSLRGLIPARPVGAVGVELTMPRAQQGRR